MAWANFDSLSKPARDLHKSRQASTPTRDLHLRNRMRKPDPISNQRHATAASFALSQSAHCQHHQCRKKDQQMLSGLVSVNILSTSRNEEMKRRLCLKKGPVPKKVNILDHLQWILKGRENSSPSTSMKAQPKASMEEESDRK